MKDQDLIDRLKADLSPVRPIASIPVALVGWLVVSVVYVLLSSSLLGPYRTGVIDQLINQPRFSIEMVVGILAFICFAATAVTESIPGISIRWVRRLGWLLAAIWLGHFLLGQQWPALEPSMFGKRAHCALEAYLYSVPPLLGMMWLQRNRFVLRPVRATSHAAIAAGLLPALIMQIACMYEPVHILEYHVLPVILLTAAAGGLAWLRWSK